MMNARYARAVFALGFPFLFAANSALAGIGDGYRTSVGTGADEIIVIVVAGTPYDMGYDAGRLIQTEAQILAISYLAYAQALDPVRFSNENLDAAWDAVLPYMDGRILQEIAGGAEGSQVPLETARRNFMVPVVQTYACSGVIVWDSATADGHLYQIRNLDYVMDAGLQDYPCIVVYLPEEGVPHVNVTFAGGIGANTGINAEGIVLGERGASPESEYPYELNGQPYNALFRAILYDAHSLTEALDIASTADRIKRYYWFFGDGQMPDGRKIRVNSPDPPPNNFIVWTDNDPADELWPNVFVDAVYHTMDNGAAVTHLTAHHGQYDADLMIELSRLVHSDHNLMNVVYDGAALELWAAFAEGQEEAYLRPYVHFDLKSLDYDEDHIPDIEEGAADPDSDSIPNFRDTDSDGDTVSDALERTLGRDPYAYEPPLPLNRPACAFALLAAALFALSRKPVMSAPSRHRRSR